LIINVILMTNLFVGVVCSEFQTAKQRKERLTNLSAEQREWVLVHDLLTQHAPKRLPRQPAEDANALRKWCFRVFYHGPSAAPLADTNSAAAAPGGERAQRRSDAAAVIKPSLDAAGGDPANGDGRAPRVAIAQRHASSSSAQHDNGWDAADKRGASFYVSLAVFIVNAVSIGCVMLEFWGMSREYELVLHLIQGVCSLLLMVNIAAKLVAIGLPLYLAGSGWDQLELVIELATPAYCACRIASLFGIAGLSHRELRLLGAVRSLRFFRLLTTSWLHTVGAIVHALYVSLPAVGNLVVLIFFWIIAFDFIGVSLFSGAVIDDWYPDGEGLSEDLNFSGLFSGFVTLCVIMRFEGWSALHADLLRGKYEPSQSRPPTWTVYAFFVVYLVTAVYMMLSVFIALLLDTLEHLNAASGNTVDQRAIRKLAERWSELDPAGDQMIDSEQLGALLRSLGPPFVTRAEVSTVKRLMRLLMHLDLPVYLPEDLSPSGVPSKLILAEEAEVTYLEVAYALAKRAVLAEEPELYELEPQLERTVLSKLPKAFPIVRYLSNNRTFTSEVAVARAIARVAFDPACGLQSSQFDAADDDDSENGLFSESVQDDTDLGLRKPKRDGSIRMVAI
jgi:hypothetical protein